MRPGLPPQVTAPETVISNLALYLHNRQPQTVNVAAALWIFRGTLRKHLSACLFTPPRNVLTKTRYVFCSPCMRTALFFLSVPRPDYHVNPAQEGHFKSLQSPRLHFHIPGSGSVKREQNQDQRSAEHVSASHSLPRSSSRSVLPGF